MAMGRRRWRLSAQKLEEARRAPSLEASEGAWPEDTLTLDFRPSVLYDSKFSVLRHPGVVSGQAALGSEHICFGAAHLFVGAAYFSMGARAV